MFLDYYKLAEQPFGVTPDSRFLYMGTKHREALASLVYGTESNRGFLALIAKPGMGKTSLLYQYLEHLRDDKARTAFIFRTDCDSREFIRHVLLDLRIDCSGMDLPAMHDALNRFLIEEAHGGRSFVLVIDEAQNLDERTLESIRLLSNFESPSKKLMHIVLSGQPHLADLLARPSLAQFRQRVSMLIRLEPLTHEEVNSYIDHRLLVAGCDRASVFTVGARKLIAEHGEGIPRNINNICFNAMSLGCAMRHKEIGRDVILEVIADLDLEPFREKKDLIAKTSRSEPEYTSSVLSAVTKERSRFSGWIPRFAILGMLFLTLGWSITQVNRHDLHTMDLTSKASVESSVHAFTKSTVVPPEPFDADKSINNLIRALPGQTLYHISIEKLGKYNGELLKQIRGLNPWLDDPDRIQSGQMIRLPSVITPPRRGQSEPDQVTDNSVSEGRLK